MHVRLESLTYDKNCPHRELRDEKVPNSEGIETLCYSHPIRWCQAASPTPPQLRGVGCHWSRRSAAGVRHGASWGLNPGGRSGIVSWWLSGGSARLEGRHVV